MKSRFSESNRAAALLLLALFLAVGMGGITASAQPAVNSSGSFMAEVNSSLYVPVNAVVTVNSAEIQAGASDAIGVSLSWSNPALNSVPIKLFVLQPNGQEPFAWLNFTAPGSKYAQFPSGFPGASSSQTGTYQVMAMYYNPITARSSNITASPIDFYASNHIAVTATVEGIGAKLPSISGPNYYSGLNGSTYAIANSASGEELVTFSGPASTDVITIHYGFGSNWKNEEMTYDGNNFTATIPLSTSGMPTQWVYYDNTTMGWYHSLYGPTGGLAGFGSPANFVDLPILSASGTTGKSWVEAQTLPNGSVFTILYGISSSSSVGIGYGINGTWESAVPTTTYNAAMGGFTYTINAAPDTGVQWYYNVNSGSQYVHYGPTGGGNFGIANLVNGYVATTGGQAPPSGAGGYNTGSTTQNSVSLAESQPEGIFVYINGIPSTYSAKIGGTFDSWTFVPMTYSGLLHGFVYEIPAQAYGTQVQYVVEDTPTGKYYNNATGSINFYVAYQPYGTYAGLNGTTRAQVLTDGSIQVTFTGARSDDSVHLDYTTNNFKTVNKVLMTYNPTEQAFTATIGPFQNGATVQWYYHDLTTGDYYNNGSAGVNFVIHDYYASPPVYRGGIVLITAYGRLPNGSLASAPAASALANIYNRDAQLVGQVKLVPSSTNSSLFEGTYDLGFSIPTGGWSVQVNVSEAPDWGIGGAPFQVLPVPLSVTAWQNSTFAERTQAVQVYATAFPEIPWIVSGNAAPESLSVMTSPLGNFFAYVGATAGGQPVLPANFSLDGWSTNANPYLSPPKSPVVVAGHSSFSEGEITTKATYYSVAGISVYSALPYAVSNHTFSASAAGSTSVSGTFTVPQANSLVIVVSGAANENSPVIVTNASTPFTVDAEGAPTLP